MERAFSTGLQLNLTSGRTSIYHCRRWDKAKLDPERTFSLPSRKAISFYDDVMQGLFFFSSPFFFSSL